jgi:transcriptional regulator with XRE-family HTH domain
MNTYREPHPICARMRELRHAAGLTLNQIARKHDIPAVVVGSYERGDRQPNLNQADRVLRMFGYRLTIEPAAPGGNGHTGNGAVDMVLTRSEMAAALHQIADQIAQAGQQR